MPTIDRDKFAQAMKGDVESLARQRLMRSGDVVTLRGDPSETRLCVNDVSIEHIDIEEANGAIYQEITYTAKCHWFDRNQKLNEGEFDTKQLTLVAKDTDPVPPPKPAPTDPNDPNTKQKDPNTNEKPKAPPTDNPSPTGTDPKA